MEYFADYDSETQLYCVFSIGAKEGFAYSSWASMEQAEADARRRNEHLKEVA